MIFIEMNIPPFKKIENAKTEKFAVTRAIFFKMKKRKFESL